MHWKSVLPGLSYFEDSCNVYALSGATGTLVIDAGNGVWLDYLGELPQPPAALLLTHFFRDHSAGAARAAELGIPVYAPAGEAQIMADPEQHFRQRETYLIYDNLWDLFAPITPTKLAGVLRDYEKLNLAGVELEVIPLPGVTLHQIGFLVSLAGKRIAFCGEAIHSPGKLARIAPLQYNYNDLGGAINAFTSARFLRERKIDILLPSLGKPPIQEAETALTQLQETLGQLVEGRPGMGQLLRRLGPEPLEQITEHVWRTTQTLSINYFVISQSGKALALDYGYDNHNLAFPAYSRPNNRRAILHSWEALRQRFGIERVDVVLVSHFHDDHVCGIPLLQRLSGTECWAPENFAELLEHPSAHCFPCNWPVPLKVDRRLPLGTPVKWEEYSFSFYPMSGHTRFSALIEFEADGQRFTHTGDQYFFVESPAEPMCDFTSVRRSQNHVYRNGALLDGFEQSGTRLLQWRPDIVVQGHRTPYFTNPDFFQHIAEWTREYRSLHEQAMPLGDEDLHFNLDSWGGWIWPYRTHLPEPGPVKVTVTARNPFPREMELQLTLVGPQGWTGTSVQALAAARAEVTCELSISPDAPCRRQAFAVELSAGGKHFGQIAEAMVSVGGEYF